MPLVVIQDDNCVLEHLLHILFSVKVEPVFEPKSAKFMVHLLLLEEVDLLRLLLVALLVETHEFQKKVLPNLLHRLCHEDFATELWVHCDERRTIELFEGRYEDYLYVFDRQDIEVTQVKLGCTPVDEELTIDAFEESSAIWGFHLW